MLIAVLNANGTTTAEIAKVKKTQVLKVRTRVHLATYGLHVHVVVCESDFFFSLSDSEVKRQTKEDGLATSSVIKYQPLRGTFYYLRCYSIPLTLPTALKSGKFSAEETEKGGSYLPVC